MRSTHIIGSMKSTRIIAVALALFLLPACLFALTLDEEKKHGREIFSEVSRAGGIVSDPYVSIYAGIIRSRLESTADLPLPIKLTVIDSPTLDAFATVGGYVFITTGMLEQADREEEIAGVLAHEFGHVGRRHIAKAVEKEKYINWGSVAAMLLAALAPGDSKGAVMAAGIGASQALSLKYTREAEEEADRVGVTIAERAGYNGRGSANFLKKMRGTSDEKSVPQYLLSHPYSDERVVKVEQMAKQTKTRVDDTLFPFVLARINVLGRPLTKQTEEMWLNRFKKEPKNPVYAYGLALCYDVKGNTGQARELIEKMESPHRSLFLGEFLFNSGRFREAVDVLSDETNPIARYYLARAYEGQGNLVLAAKTYKELIPFGRDFPEAYQRMGLTFGRQGMEGPGYEYLGRYYLEAGREASARTNLEKAVAKYGINSKESEEVIKLLDQIRGPQKKLKG